MKRINALTIAGTDPSGGAGIQADLKAFSALQAYGTSVITALVAQNTRGVQSVYPIEPAFVAAQLDSVLSDVRIDSAKIEMSLMLTLSISLPGNCAVIPSHLWCWIP